MKNALLFIVLTLLMSGCFYPDEFGYNVDDELKPYHILFLNEGISRGVNYSARNTSIHFGSAGGNLGKSYNSSRKSYINIEINRVEWELLTPNGKEVLMMHELGHASLNREHEEHCYSVMKTDIGCSIINYQTNRDEMLDELFSISY